MLLMAQTSHKPNASIATCCLLMAGLFAYSAAVQLNDVDWYLWFPFYTLASVVSAFHTVSSTVASRGLAGLDLVFGLVLFVKVVIEGCIHGRSFNVDELFSLDMAKRVVREKLGSLLAVVAMWLQMEVFSGTPTDSAGYKWAPQAGLWLFVAVSSGLCLAFFIETAPLSTDGI
eukprot:c19918_g1_i1 orf=556-1074(+)